MVMSCGSVREILGLTVIVSICVLVQEPNAAVEVATAVYVTVCTVLVKLVNWSVMALPICVVVLSPETFALGVATHVKVEATLVVKFTPKLPPLHTVAVGELVKFTSG